MESLKWSFENEFGVEIILRAYTTIYMCAHTAVPIVNKRLASRQAHGTSKPAICAKVHKIPANIWKPAIAGSFQEIYVDTQNQAEIYTP
jgi:hypothetical protein